jgi:DNA topoisomerase-1
MTFGNRKEVPGLQAAAKTAKLHYASDTRPGIARVRTSSGFRYRSPDGCSVTDAEPLARIRKLAIPPAYEQVWICQDPNGHLQAVGRDARGRKQYRYHPRWREARDEGKYGRMLLFGKLLPKLRARVQEDLSRRGLPREKVLAVIVRLLETTLMRVDNEEYARNNKSYGLTTLLAAVVRRCQKLPGQDLFQYVGEDDAPPAIGSEDVNDYLRSISEEEITAKDFRTWAGTNLAALALRELESFDNETMAKKNVVRAVETVSRMLGNTPAICRKVMAFLSRQLATSKPMALGHASRVTAAG